MGARILAVHLSSQEDVFERTESGDGVRHIDPHPPNIGLKDLSRGGKAAGGPNGTKLKEEEETFTQHIEQMQKNLWKWRWDRTRGRRGARHLSFPCCTYTLPSSST